MEEVLGIAQKCGICGIGESLGMFHGAEPSTDVVQMVVGSMGSIELGKQIICEQGLASRDIGEAIIIEGTGNICWGWFQTWNRQLQQVEKMHEPLYLVNPIIEVQVFHRFSIFIGRLFQWLGETIGAVLGTGDMNKSEVE